MTRSASASRKALTVGFAALCGSVSLIYPFGRDQGTYGYAGWVLLDGGMPYREVLVVKPPMTILVHSAAMGLFGINTWAIRVFDIGWTALSAIVVAAIALELWGRRDCAMLAGLAYPFLYYQIDYWNIAQTDGWMVLPSALAVWAVLRGGRAFDQSRGRAFAMWGVAGLLAGVAVLFKYTGGAIGLPMLLALASVVAKQGGRAWLGVVAMLAGGLLALGACWLWLAAGDAWSAFVEIQRDMVIPYVQRRSSADTVGATFAKLVQLRGTRADLLPLCLAAPLAAVPAAAGARRDGAASWWGIGIVLSWWLAGVSNVVVQGKFFDYHYLPLLVPAALLAGYGFSSLLRGPLSRMKGSWSRAATLAALAVTLIALTPLGSRFRDLASLALGDQTVDGYIATRREYSFPSYDVEEVRRVSELAQQLTVEEQRVFVWGFEPTINVRARRHTVSRFSSNRPFFPHLRSPELETELLEALHATPPDLFIVGSRDRVLGPTGTYEDSGTILRSFDELDAFVHDRYEPVQEVGRYSVLQLRPAVPPQSQ